MNFDLKQFQVPAMPEDFLQGESLFRAYYRHLLKTVDSELVRQVEIIEGRWPSDTEIARHAHCFIYPDGAREYKWRSVLILRVEPISSGLCLSGHRLISLIPPEQPHET